MSWERVKVGELVRFNYGKALVKQDRVETGKFDVFSSAGLIGRHNESSIESETIVVGRKGSAGSVIHAASGGRIIDTAYYLTPISEGQFDWKYLYYALKNLNLERLATATAMPGLNREDVYKQVVPLPPLPVQRRIAAVLDEVDALRQKREQSIEKLRQLREAIYIAHLRQYLGSSQQVKVSDLINPSKGGMRTGPFGSQLLHSEFVDDPDGIMVLGIDNAVKNRFQYAGERYITAEKYTKLKRYTVYPGDVLVTIMGTCGRVAIVPDNIPTAINTKHLCAMTLNERCLPEFLHATLTYNPDVLRQMGASARGAIMDGLNMGIISNVEFPLLSITAQQELKKRFKEIDALIEKTNSAQKHEVQLLGSLQARAFAGELKFGAWELTVQDAQTFTEALINPASPNDALREAAQRGKESLG